MTLALLVFGATYCAIAAGSVPYLSLDRPAAALLGAVMMVAVGVLTPGPRVPSNQSSWLTFVDGALEDERPAPAERAVGGGASRTLRLDQTTKSLGHAVLRLPIDEVPGS